VNRRFGSTTRAGAVGAALQADDELHDVLVRACGNRAVAATIARQAAAVAAHAGLACVLAPETWVDWPDAVYDKAGNILISRLAGADVRLVRAGFGIGVKESWEPALREVEESGGRPYAIPAGASAHPLGGLGFAHWALRSGRTGAGGGDLLRHGRGALGDRQCTGRMVAGSAALDEAGGRGRRVIGIDASAAPERTREQIARIACNTASLIGVERELRDEEIELDDRHHAGAYGIPDDTTPAAMRLAARTEGMVTDPVYEGKPMAGLIDLVTRGEIGAGARALHAHLGGQPALNADSALF
jgi:1-aminocyclopropane-1-carboxylate deaminase